MNQPTGDNDVRVETGVRQGDDVSQYYDPMIAKLVVWGSDRQAALDKMSQKLSEYRVVGLPTNIQFLKRCAESDEFQAAGFLIFFKFHLLIKHLKALSWILVLLLVMSIN